MPVPAARWPQQLKADTLQPVYLLVGEEMLVLEAADALRARARELGYTEREVLSVESGFDWDDLARAGAGMSLFASRRMLDLRLPTGKPGRDGSKALTAYCENPPPDTVLLVTCVTWSKKHEGAWSKALDKAGVQVVFWPPRPHEMPAWIGARLARYGIQAETAALSLLAERVEGNLLAAAQEVDKLALLHSGGRMDAATMESLVADSARYDIFRLSDAAFGGDAARALRVMRGLQAEGEELIPMLGWLVSQLQIALRLATAPDFAAQARAERLWQAREQLFRQALRRAPREHWQACLAQAARIDRMSKGREGGDPWREMQRLVARIADPRGARALASA
ncbi:DNA polymerase III subunit delta [Oleiagrimonas sp. MCCC 1A03011]|uniref:DNA polymerase III subunit delta n=1 Tax=Oleiagrimonas sp. MCCC 1A03011 TaxID=1926883 RepID=UPI000DC437CC|nr:DNA polymerase III subunit delta [Oleiagrimonas sp. MCCC 1A03011]RAP57452.1 DNA polymerase III subunit delta [Oleiagrimonas sp. MCCC 1A03011]